MDEVKIGVAPHRLSDTIEVGDESATLLTLGRRAGAVAEGRLCDSGASPDDRGPGLSGFWYRPARQRGILEAHAPLPSTCQKFPNTIRAWLTPGQFTNWNAFTQLGVARSRVDSRRADDVR